LAELVDEDPGRNTAEGEVLFQAGRHLGETLQQVALIVDPQAIVVAGKLSKASAYVAGCQSVWADRGATPQFTPPKLIVGQVAAIRAAGFLALDGFVYSPQLAIDGLIDDVAPSRKEVDHVGR
jgi:predicted NBD/HSP70 family sugar kinase